MCRWDASPTMHEAIQAYLSAAGDAAQKSPPWRVDCYHCDGAWGSPAAVPAIPATHGCSITFVVDDCGSRRGDASPARATLIHQPCSRR